VDVLASSRPRRAGERMAGSYANFYIATSRIVFPLLDQRFDEQAAELLGGCFPDREIVGVAGREILLGGGNIHCITQQVPAVGKRQWGITNMPATPSANTAIASSESGPRRARQR
jgi:hypothetical protein